MDAFPRFLGVKKDAFPKNLRPKKDKSEPLCLNLVDYHPLAKQVVPNPHKKEKVGNQVIRNYLNSSILQKSGFQTPIATLKQQKKPGNEAWLSSCPGRVPPYRWLSVSIECSSVTNQKGGY
jgi:hypothetical protein